jgi:hypothetical protein
MFKDSLSTLKAAKSFAQGTILRKTFDLAGKKTPPKQSFFRSFSKPSCRTSQIQKEKNKQSLAMNTRGRRPLT